MTLARRGKRLALVASAVRTSEPANKRCGLQTGIDSDDAKRFAIRASVPPAQRSNNAALRNFQERHKKELENNVEQYCFDYTKKKMNILCFTC